jgi:hypothetical protein
LKSDKKNRYWVMEYKNCIPKDMMYGSKDMYFRLKNRCYGAKDRYFRLKNRFYGAKVMYFRLKNRCYGPTDMSFGPVYRGDTPSVGPGGIHGAMGGRAPPGATIPITRSTG